MKVLQFSRYANNSKNNGFSNRSTGFGNMVFDISYSIANIEKISVDLLTINNFPKERNFKNLNFPKKNWRLIFSNFKLNYFLRAIHTIKEDKPPLRMLPRYFFYFLSLGFIKKILEKNKYDLIHIHGIGPSTQPMIDLCETLNQKYLVTLHGLISFSDSVNASNKHKEYERNLLKKAFTENIPITVISTGIKNIITKPITALIEL